MQLEKARDAVSVANLRAAYAEASTKYLADEFDDDNKNSVTISNVIFEGTKSEGDDKASSYSGLAADLAFSGDVVTTEPSKGPHSIKFTWASDGNVTAALADSTTGK